MKIYYVLLCAFGIALSGCTTPQYNYRPEVQEISRPPLHAVNVANIGDEMLSQGVYSEQEAIKLDKDIRFGLLGYYTLTPGYYVKTGEDRRSSFYRPAGGGDSGQVQKGALSDPWESIQLSKDGSKISIITIFHASVSERADGVRRTVCSVLSSDSFQQTLIYSGKVGAKVRIGYREFSNNSARPAFNNDVDYDLSQSKVIGYKGARIEIIEATNEYVKYKVISNFNKAAK